MSEKRTQNKGTKKQQEIQNYRRKEKSFNWARGFCAFGYWSDRNRGDVECCRYPTDSEEGYERIF